MSHSYHAKLVRARIARGSFSKVSAGKISCFAAGKMRLEFVWDEARCIEHQLRRHGPPGDALRPSRSGRYLEAEQRAWHRGR
ncbi:hypothetical protein CBM2617_U10176 [Cupriavidus taiwanensis]|nr:hypothetical protein CBM2617_U10176 [Cupriavidus taiwanensis]